MSSALPPPWTYVADATPYYCESFECTNLMSPSFSRCRVLATGNPETNEVSWTPPQASAATTSAQPPWTYVSEVGSAPYWWNTVTNEVSWVLPGPAPSTSETPLPLSGTAAAGVRGFDTGVSAMVPPEPGGGSLPPALAQRLAQRGIGRTNSAVQPAHPSQHADPSSQPPALAQPAQAQSAAAPPALPPGWTQHRDPEGKMFYRQAATGRTVWTHPALVAPPPVPPHAAALPPPPPPQAGRAVAAPPPSAPSQQPRPAPPVTLQQTPQYAGIGPGYSKAVKMPSLPTHRPTPYGRPGGGGGKGRGGKGGGNAGGRPPPSRGGSAYDRAWALTLCFAGAASLSCTF